MAKPKSQHPRAFTQIEQLARKGMSDTSDKSAYLLFQKIADIANPQDASRGGLPSQRRKTAAKKRRTASKKPE